MTHTLYRNFLGKWFGKAKTITLSETGITLVDIDQNVKTILVKQLIDFPVIEQSILGHKLIIKTRVPSNNKIKTSKIWGISRLSTKHFNSEAKTDLYKNISANISRHTDIFHQEAITQYLRDSSVNILHETVTPLVQSYLATKVRWKKILSTQQWKDVDVISRMPSIKDTKSYREYFETSQLKKYATFFDNIESNPLTLEQRLAVIRNNDKNLVLAAAGTGKTSVMVAKALHLIAHDRVPAENVLILAYNNSAAAELKERLESRKQFYNIPGGTPTIMTFHALGQKILKSMKENSQLTPFATNPLALETWFSNWLSSYIKHSDTNMNHFIDLVCWSLDHSTTLQTHSPSGNHTSYQNNLKTIETMRLQGQTREKLFASLKSTGIFAEQIKLHLKYLQAIRVEQLNNNQIDARLVMANINAVNAKKIADFLSQVTQAYATELASQKAIDFDDMITQAFTQVNCGHFVPPWSDILVDEFQDISSARMALLNEIIYKGPRPKLTVVGDDWQSIYRFSGGNLALITQFLKYSGSHTLTTLQKTFRYNNSIAQTAGQFVMENIEQYPKKISTHHQVESSQICLVESDTDSLKERITEIVTLIRANDPTGKIAIMARYKYLLNHASTNSKTQNTQENNNLHYWTFHGSKGLEADYCIITGLFNGKTGFPNNNKEDPIIEALLPKSDGFKHSEERRLFYVALTRAKKKVYLIADPNKPSVFIEELLSPSYELQIMSSKFKALKSKLYS